MHRFSPLRLQHEQGQRWKTLDPLRYMRTADEIYVVPSGFSTDLDSVPRIPVLHAWLKARATRSAVVHDYLYRQRYDRAEADAVFFDAMKHEGVPAWRRWPIYLGVRSGGWLAYRNKAGQA